MNAYSRSTQLVIAMATGILLFFIAVGPERAQGQGLAGLYDSTEYDCVTSSFDATYHNWYAFHNGCSVTVTIVYSGEKGGCDGQVSVFPGATQNTGLDKDMIQNCGGSIVTAVCKNGYVAVDQNDNYYKSGAGSGYRCKFQP